MLAADAALERRVRLAPALGADPHQLADPGPSMVSNGLRSMMRPARYDGMKPPSTSSRESPIVVWVRSLVPKEKKSAWWAMWPAIRHARGSRSSSRPSTGSRSRLRACLLGDVDHVLPQLAQLGLVGHQRDHDLDVGVFPAAAASAAAPITARTCIS